MGRLLFFLALVGAVLSGYWFGKEPTAVQESLLSVHPEKEFPVVERKNFAIVVYASNDALWCERTLRSIFEQEYEPYRVFFVDDGSQDNTYEIARSFIVENNQDHRVILVRNETKVGPVACLYRASDTLLDKEIVLPLSAKDWLATPDSLSRLSAAYQNPDVWLTFSSSIEYPSYEKISLDGPCSFYTGLFRQIHLADLFRGGDFVKSRKTYLEPLVAMAGGRVRFLNEPLAFANHSLARQEKEEKTPSSYRPLVEFPHPNEKEQTADLLLFSFNRPLQLYACLESIDRYLSGFEKISVIYRTSSDRFAAGYEQVKEAFPHVNFIRQSESTPKKDFKPLVLQTVFGSPSQFVLFGVDDLIVKDFVDLKLCMEAMERTNAYGFYLRFGKHIRFCYQIKQPQAIPESFPLSSNIFAWDLKTGQHDWGYPNTVDMTLFRKKDLKQALETTKFSTPTSLEYNWANGHPPKQALGLYFEHSKVVNLPLNIVDRTGNPHMNYGSAEELLVRFEEGMKIDIDPLYRIDNPSPHFDYAPQFVIR